MRIGKKILSQEKASVWLDSNPTAKSILVSFDSQRKNISVKNGYGKKIVEGRDGSCTPFSDDFGKFLNYALIKLLKNEFVQLLTKIQSPNFSALTYWNGNAEQKRYSEACNIEINRLDPKGIRDLYRKIGFDVKKVYCSNTLSIQVLYILSPSIK